MLLVESHGRCGADWDTEKKDKVYRGGSWMAGEGRKKRGDMKRSVGLVRTASCRFGKRVRGTNSCARGARFTRRRLFFAFLLKSSPETSVTRDPRRKPGEKRLIDNPVQNWYGTILW